jgi:hypothetical protein
MKFESAFFCDDVRQEANGKYIFIGVYGDDIIINSFPTGMNLYLVISARFEKAEPQEIEIEARLSDKIALKGKLQANVVNAGLGFLPIPIPLLQILAPGLLNVRLKINDAKWRDTSSINIKPANPSNITSPPIAPPPPS